MRIEGTGSLVPHHLVEMKSKSKRTRLKNLTQLVFSSEFLKSMFLHEDTKLIGEPPAATYLGKGEEYGGDDDRDEELEDAPPRGAGVVHRAVVVDLRRRRGGGRISGQKTVEQVLQLKLTHLNIVMTHKDHRVRLG